jgi:hypothetical protein
MKFLNWFYRAVVFFGPFLMATLNADGQHLLLSAGAEKNIGGLAYECALAVELKSRVCLGVFLQTQVPAMTTFDFKSKQHFYGIQFEAPVATSERLGFFAGCNAGVVNEQFFALVPNVTTKVRLSKHLRFSVATGIRMGNPLINGKISLVL